MVVECEAAGPSQKAVREMDGGAQLTFSFVLWLGPRPQDDSRHS